MFQTSVKLVIMHSNKRDLARLIEKKSKFWQVVDFKDTPLYPQCLIIATFVKKIIRFYFFTAMSAGIFFDLQPLTTGFLPTGCYVPQGWYNFLKVMMWYMSCVVLFSVQGTDCFFCSLASSLTVQFKLLAYKFKNLTIPSSNDENTGENLIWSELQKLIDYHNYLLRYCINFEHQSICIATFSVTAKNLMWFLEAFFCFSLGYPSLRLLCLFSFLCSRKLDF